MLVFIAFIRFFITEDSLWLKISEVATQLHFDRRTRMRVERKTHGGRVAVITTAHLAKFDCVHARDSVVDSVWSAKQDYMLMNPEVRAIDGRDLLIRAKHDIEALMKRKQETVEV